MTATPQSNATLAEIAEALLERNSFAVCGHVSPDGDCIGSALALAAALRACGKRVVCLTASEDPLDATLATLPGADGIVPAKGFAGQIDAFVAVDTPSPSRLGDGAAVHERAPFTVTVDHHACEQRMSDLSYTDPDVASTTMLVWELAGLLGVERGSEIAQCAYTGLMTDTGGFRFQNADARAFFAAAEMVASGADPARAALGFFQNRSLASYALSQRAFDRLRLVDDAASVALAWITAADMEETGAVRADAEPIIEELRSIRGVRVACLLREQEGGVRGSLRAKDGTDVARIARHFGGGGHVAAAGFTTDGPIEEAAEAVAILLAAEAGASS